ncbi:phospholipid carrier-dependent glycosyltransferase [Candidatus Parcubacteria bacterium]|nr:MAG: phospholipid carrier-dependent glycosyltransferase [Candidatus Parcubacteria bacterium]
MGRRDLLLLIAIVFLAFMFRFYRVAENPPALNWDEISIGYNAYSILKTGKDEWGEVFPVHFQAYGEYKLPAQIYASIPGIALLGLNELGVRITPVVYGTLTVLITFFLTRIIFQSNIIGLLASFLLAISPWHIHLTRASFESSFAVFWIVLGFWWLIKGFEDKKWWILSMIPLALSIYTYNSARVFTPIFIITTILIFRKTFLKSPRIIVLSAITLIILLLPLVPYYLSGEGNARYKLVSITDDPGFVLRINEYRGSSTLPSPLPRLIYNKLTYGAFVISQNYLTHFSPDFLFISGAPHKQHHVQGVGELYLFQAPFVLIGFLFLFRKKIQFRWFLISWLLLAFVPVSVTNDSIPHALRTLIAVPVYQLISAFGLYEAYLLFKPRRINLSPLFMIMVVVVISLSVSFYLQNYFQKYAKLYSRDWQYGYKQAVEYIKEHQQDYDEIIFTRHYGEPQMFTLFYLQFDPVRFQNNPNLIRFKTYDWVRVLRFDKFYFPDLSDKETRYVDIINQNPDRRLLFIGKPGDFPFGQHILKTINFLDGQVAFEIVEVK